MKFDQSKTNDQGLYNNSYHAWCCLRRYLAFLHHLFYFQHEYLATYVLYSKRSGRGLGFPVLSRYRCTRFLAAK